MMLPGNTQDASFYFISEIQLSSGINKSHVLYILKIICFISEIHIHPEFFIFLFAKPDISIIIFLEEQEMEIYIELGSRGSPGHKERLMGSHPVSTTEDVSRD